MKLDLNFTITLLDKTQDAEIMGKMVANSLGFKTTYLDDERAVLIAKRLYDNNFCIEIDGADLADLSKEVDDKQAVLNQRLTNLGTTELKRAIQEAKRS